MSTKIKICFFNDFFPFSRGGAEYQAYLLAKSLDPERYDVSFVSRGGNSEGEYHIDGFRIFFLNPLNFYKKFGRPYCLYYNQIKAILKNVRPHIVYQRTGSAVTGILSRLSSAYGFTFVWASASDVDLSMHTPSFRILSNIDDILRISGIRNAETVLAQSLAQQSRLVEKFGRQAIILPNGHPIPEKKMHKDPINLKVVWIGAFKPVKQPDMFLDLANDFSTNYNVKFVMIGRSGNLPDWSALQARMEKLHNLVYQGEQPQEFVNEILSSGHVFVNTSSFEGFPNTFIQAWMRRVPVVSLNVNPDNLLIEKQIGFRSGSYQNLLRDVTRLLRDKSLRDAMGERAQKYAIKNYSSKSVSERFNLLIQAIVPA